MRQKRYEPRLRHCGGGLELAVRAGAGRKNVCAERKEQRQVWLHIGGLIKISKYIRIFEARFLSLSEKGIINMEKKKTRINLTLLD